MPRAREGEPTKLGAAVRHQRGSAPLHQVGANLGVTYSTLSRIERGTHRPSYDTAKALADWLGWTVEQVMEAAARPAASMEHEAVDDVR